MELEEAQNRLGGWEKWQILMYIMVSCGATITSAWHMLAIVYIGEFQLQTFR